MATAALNTWTPGTDLPYVVSLGEKMLAILLPAAWVKADRSGEPLLLPPAVRALDRLRALFANRNRFTPGFIVSLREGLGLTQEAFGRKLGVSKMTVSRWECGRMRPSPSAITAMQKLREGARREGVEIDGAKRMSKSSHLVHSIHRSRKSHDKR
jgi:DNA-binding transcriptional regulator YiaG